MAAVPEIILAMRDAAPRGLQSVEGQARRKLSLLTQELISARPDAAAEHARFLSIRDRQLAVAGSQLDSWLGGKTVLVTGGTGCVGSVLMRQAAAGRPARLVSVSRGTRLAWPTCPQAEYLQADIRDRGALDAVFRLVRPDVVFHLAAQRDPGLAEREVHRTVTTNLLGTRNVIAAAEAAGAADVVYASTGKALRPFSREVYTASKRGAEWLLAAAADGGGASYSAARFTHVVDNSIIYDKLRSWCGGDVIRLHDAGILFYAQSALESAQLLLCAGLSAQRGLLGIQALADLGWPVSLLDLALAVLLQTGSQVPIYVSGHDPGYEAAPFPGLYDPLTAGDVSPLISGFEASHVQRVPGLPVDSYPMCPVLDSLPEKLLDEIENVCAATTEPAPVRAALDELSWSLFGATMKTVPRAVLARAARLTEPYRDGLGCDHRQMLEVISQQLAAAPSPVS